MTKETLITSINLCFDLGVENVYLISFFCDLLKKYKSDLKNEIKNCPKALDLIIEEPDSVKFRVDTSLSTFEKDEQEFLSMNDITLEVNNSHIESNRLMLYTSFEYFNKIFQYENKAKDIYKIDLPHVEIESLLLLIEYLKTSSKESFQNDPVSCVQMKILLDYFIPRNEHLNSFSQFLSKCIEKKAQSVELSAYFFDLSIVELIAWREKGLIPEPVFVMFEREIEDYQLVCFCE